jgi:subtilisin family serine protease
MWELAWPTRLAINTSPSGKAARYQELKPQVKNALIEKFIEPNRDELEFVEPDVYIEVPKPVVDSSIQAQFVEVNWQHTAMQTSYAWNKNLKGSGVVVAVVDSGADVSHPLLQSQLAVNASEVPGNSVDDDGNGLVDDYQGYDFFRKTGAVTDQHGHGSHVSGTIAAAISGDVSLPIGVAPEAKILPLNFMDNAGRGSTSNAILALRYARIRGVQIVNASWGSADCSTALRDVIEELEASNILVVAAAGNSGLNIDLYPNFPASYPSANVIAVAASTVRGLTADFSNYSPNSVHVAAPGKDIYSTVPPSTYGFYSGTSMAAPQVSGLAAIIWSARPDLNLGEVKAAIMAGSEGQFYPVVSRGEIDVKKTLQNLGL